MNRIYTRTGDDGTTAIHGGLRVPKTDIRIEANGCLDELNVAVGAIRTSLPADHMWQSQLREIQLNLMSIMSLVATVSEKRMLNPNQLPDKLVSDLECWIDDINSQCTPPDSFILPGGTPLATQIHQARVTARRAERNLWRINDLDPELFAEELERNVVMRKAIKEYAESGGKMLAECGGMIYLTEEIDGKRMCGVFPLKTTMESARLTLGYRKVIFPDLIIKGHEFHYSHTASTKNLTSVAQQYNVKGMPVATPIYRYRNTFAGYTHLYWGETDIFKLWNQ